jgi:hypothetical protein
MSFAFMFSLLRLNAFTLNPPPNAVKGKFHNRPQSFHDARGEAGASGTGGHAGFRLFNHPLAHHLVGVVALKLDGIQPDGLLQFLVIQQATVENGFAVGRSVFIASAHALTLA